MSFLGVVNALMLRTCFSVTITEMVVKKSPNRTHDVCEPDPEWIKEELKKPHHDHEEIFNWNQEVQGILLSSFFIGYLITHIPGGIVADKFGGKHTLGIGILLTSIFTFLIPVSARAGYEWLAVVRAVTGLGEGSTFPAVSNILAKWIPTRERGFFGGLVFTGTLIGTVLGNTIAGAILHNFPGDWPLVFYVFGSIGIIWWVLWQSFCFSAPYNHPCITQKETDYLTEQIGPKEKRIPSPPWKKILTSCPVWALMLAEIGHDWAFYIMSTNLPKYMSDVLRYPVKENSFFSSLPWMCMWLVAILSGLLGDWLIRTNRLSITATRKVFTAIAHTGPAIGFIAASYAECNRPAVVALFTVSMSIMGTFYPGMRVNAIDLSPNFAGTIMALVNGIGAIAGFLAPLTIGMLTTNTSIYEWRRVFWITSVVNMATVFIFAVWGTGKLQPWNEIEKEPED